MKIGHIVEEEGCKSHGMLEIAKTYAGSPIGIPIIIVNGTEKGPILCVVSGIHGDEYVGGEVIRRLTASIDPMKVRGTLVTVPVVNMPAFEAGTRISVWDWRDTNRVFPGRPEGHITEMIAYHLLNEIVLKSDYCIDFHSPGAFFRAVPQVNYQEVEGELGQRTMKMAKSAGIKYLWNYARAGCLHTEAMNRGVSSIAIDYIGEESRVSEKDVDLGLRCLTNIMKHLGMLEGTPDVPDEYILLSGRTVEDNQMFSTCGGFFQREVEAGEKVSQGDVLGIIYDVFGREMERICAPLDNAIVMAIRTYPSIRPGDWCAFAPKVVGKLERLYD